MTQTHAQRIARTEEDMDNDHGMKSNQHAQLELTTKLLERQAELEDQVTRLMSARAVHMAEHDELIRLRERLAYSESIRASLKEQLRMLTDGAGDDDTGAVDDDYRVVRLHPDAP